MVALKRTNQTGAVLSFVIVAIVLAVSVIGTAYFVEHRGQQVRADQAAAQADKLAKLAGTVSRGADKGAVTATPTPTAPAKPATPAANPAPSTTNSPTPPSSTQPSNTKSAPLPTTGPESSLIDLLAIGLLVASATAYATSHRRLSRTL